MTRDVFAPAEISHAADSGIRLTNLDHSSIYKDLSTLPVGNSRGDDLQVTDGKLSFSHPYGDDGDWRRAGHADERFSRMNEQSRTPTPETGSLVMQPIAEKGALAADYLDDKKPDVLKFDNAAIQSGKTYLMQNDGYAATDQQSPQNLSPLEAWSTFMRDSFDALLKACQKDGPWLSPQLINDYNQILWRELQNDFGQNGWSGGDGGSGNGCGNGSGNGDGSSGNNGNGAGDGTIGGPGVGGGGGGAGDGSAGNPGDNTGKPGDGTAKPGDTSDINALIHVGSGVSQDSVQAVEQAIKDAPAPLQKALRDLKPDIEVVTGQEDPNYQQGAAAYWDPANNRMVIYAGTGIEKEAASHEIWHAADSYYGITNDPGFRQAVAADIQNGAVQKLGGAASILVDEPVVNGVRVGDAFAEVGAAISHDDVTGIAGLMAQSFSNTDAWMQQWVQQHSA
jgi:hypothetical protein